MRTAHCILDISKEGGASVRAGKKISKGTCYMHLFL